MKISFRTYDDGLKTEVHVNNKLIGHVEIDIWNQKWKMNPYFHFNPNQRGMLHVEYDSSYESGKAMVNLYNGTLESFEDIDENDTDEIDMRGFINLQIP
jgi:hypothetical protein